MFEQHAGRWVRSELFGGRGEVAVADLLGRREAKPFQAVLGCELAPGGSVGVHHQTEAHEIVVCVEGRGRATVGGETHDLVSGTMVYVALGSTLALENTDAEAPLRYLIIKAK
ncbi:MAG: cupin domain-containing protein [Polyangiaceae bacterium]|nr:cupin domain-containing protein [Polyangiaceae bacterium]